MQVVTDLGDVCKFAVALVERNFKEKSNDTGTETINTN